MAFTAETLFEDVSRKSWVNAGFLAPSATEVKAGTVMYLSSTSSLLLAVVTGASPTVAGLLGQTVRNLDTGPISGIRDLVTTDRNYSDTVSLIRGSNDTVVRMGQQNSTDKQCGWDVRSAINVNTPLYTASTTDEVHANGGVYDLSTTQTLVGKSLSQVSVAADILTMIFNPAL